MNFCMSRFRYGLFVFAMIAFASSIVMPKPCHDFLFSVGKLPNVCITYSYFLGGGFLGGGFLGGGFF